MEAMNDQAGAVTHVVDSFMGVLNAAVAAPGARPNIDALDFNDYKAACQEYLGENVLSDRAIEDHVRRDIEQNAHVLESYPPDARVCPVVIPFDTYRRPLSEQAIEKGDHLHTFVVDSHGVTIRGMAAGDSYVFDLLPDEVKALSFEVPDSVEEFARLYRERCGMLRQLLS